MKFSESVLLRQLHPPDMSSTTTVQPVKSRPNVSPKKDEPTLQTIDHEELRDLPGMIMPFKSRLSFAPLLRFWETRVESDDIAEKIMATEIMKRVEQHPELWEPIEDYEDLVQYSEIVELLLAGLFPLNLRETQLGKATRPFDMNVFYKTPRVQAMMSSCAMNVKIEKSAEFFSNAIVVNACSVILNQHYGQNLDVDPTIIYTMAPKDGGVMRHYKSEMNIKFVEMVPTKPLKKLTQEDINKLVGNVYDTEAWLAAIPPENFEIQGVVGINLIDVTKEESVSRIRFSLLEKDAIVKAENIQNLERLVQSYYGMSDLKMGIMALDFPANQKDAFKYNIRHCILENWDSCMLDEKNANSIYEKAATYQETVLVEDLKAMPNKTAAERKLLDMGYRSIMVTPLVNKENGVIGMLELATPRSYGLNSFSEFQLQNLLPLFNMAIERSREETDNTIEAIIREKFTAIHPSVEWRFSQAAFNHLNSAREANERVPMEPIAFQNVFPLYAQSDIVSSSTLRNQSIQEDLLKNLELLKSMLKLAEKHVDFPLLDQYLLETDYRIKELSKEMRSSDESHVIDFIQNEVHPLIEEMAKKDRSVAHAFSRYKSQLDPHFGVVYHKRKDYEESVNRINQTISDYLELEEERGQAMLPHYFEKYKTDGVQFELYVGQSLLQNGEFNNMHLRNFRLWQMQAITEITRQMEALKAELPMPLETAQLVFVYGSPISIRFRMDDKRFDVDGAYNIRYEIIKKRIDKATVTLADGSQERLTQAGKVAIVYAREEDREEYLYYLTYLKRKGLIEREIEDLDLDKLQGVQGLKALRVTVKK
ncbi:MAG: hypothetical protein AAFZ15_24225 [Bacteroidota bacterium]